MTTLVTGATGLLGSHLIDLQTMADDDVPLTGQVRDRQVVQRMGEHERRETLLGEQRSDALERRLADYAQAASASL